MEAEKSVEWGCPRVCVDVDVEVVARVEKSPEAAGQKPASASRVPLLYPHNGCTLKSSIFHPHSKKIPFLKKLLLLKNNFIKLN